MRLLKLNNGRSGISPTRELILSLIPFLILFLGYAITAHVRHKENPDDNIVPQFSSLKEGFLSALIDVDRIGEYAVDLSVPIPGLSSAIKKDFDSRAIKVNVDSGSIRFQFGGILITDIIATGKRFFIALAIIMLGIMWGLHMGLFQDIEALSYKFLMLFDKIPAPALLPILFIYFGIDDAFKIALVVSGVMPSIILDTYFRVKKDVAKENIITGFTLGATDAEVAYRIVLPQIFPKVLDTIRLNFKAIGILLIFGEVIASEAGLGYRINILRRTMDMATIIPYCLVLGILLFSLDWLVAYGIKQRYRWLRK